MKTKITPERNPTDNSIILSPPEPKYSIIWLHGLGDSSQGFFDWFNMPSSPLYLGARIRLLQAPVRKVTVNGGVQFPSWYDIKTFDLQKLISLPDEQVFSLPEIQESYKIIDKHVQEQANYWKTKGKSEPYKRIFVGGFSQGCAIALSYGLSCEKPLAGIIGYSGHLFKSTLLNNLGKTPILLYHGEVDPLLNQKLSRKSYEKIEKDPSVTYHLVKGLGHSVDLPEMAGTVQWLKAHVPKD